ncbi:hypothetical protein CI109_100241 [Kwoniella shandongensis]|uniref:Uncharacterized protein n=1 Tax=Kwoniella shandongensis TaxID=1734106 RepID=A0A5M6BWN6_9TREE|nr:uncharacterized protein CI109_006223 [Kwoniella shandongensis]KAA5525419.1 hypothetical protein CI109_006223 [Kwoniella shandongensis]
MSSSTTFLISPSTSSPLPSSPSLSLLPFSLGPSSTPYVSTSVPLSKYFQPRPSPSEAHAPEGSTIASFRGRQVVGQRIAVPRGYVGLVFSTSKRPDRGGLETHQSSTTSGGGGKEYPLTPASSVPSIISEEGDPSAGNGMGGYALRRSSPRKSASHAAAVLGPGGRVRGAGQVALARPKTRQVTKVTETKKRFRLDSDDEDEDEEGEEQQGESSTTTRPSLMRTPSKRARTGYTTPKKMTASEGISPIPEIVIQEATPLKHPLPTPKKRLSTRSRSRRGSPSPSPASRLEDNPTSGVLPVALADVKEVADRQEMEMEVEVEHVEDVSSPSPSPSSSGNLSSNGELDSEGVKQEENLIPSPATEDDPPSFNIETPTTEIRFEPKYDANSTITEAETKDTKAEMEVDGPVRVLRPVSRFEGFMLYTPDVPLAGFRADEGAQAAKPTTKADNETSEKKSEIPVSAVASEVGTAEAGTQGESIPPGGSGIQVRKSWWRTGGAGEGGDEMVRAMGEWLGLVETLNKPVYLEGLDDDDSDDDE